MGLFDKLTRQAEQFVQAAQAATDAMQQRIDEHTATYTATATHYATFCPQCGSVLPDTAKYCSSCGAPAASLVNPISTRRGYAFFDVETPNRHNDRICSIGVIRTDDTGAVIGKKYSLVDPDTEFDAINTSIHGISEFDVHGAPAFPAVWEEVHPLFHDATLVAHNARFDLSVLDKALDAHGIEHGSAYYICTMSMATAHHPELGKFKLDHVCKACGVTLENHHNAISDAEACMGVFFALGGHEEPTEYIPQSHRRPRAQVYNVRKSEESKAHNELMKHAMDILEDGRVSLEEAIGLHWWLEKNANLTNDATVIELLSMLSDVLEDGVVDPDEERRLISMLGRIVNPANNEITEGIEGKKFCLTGDFDYGSKDDVAAHLESLGGIRSNSVTKTCNYVIIGNQGSAAYAHGNYGSKVKKAMEWQSKGVPMQIVSENDCPWL